jgi:hypothetical protein
MRKFGFQLFGGLFLILLWGVALTAQEVAETPAELVKTAFENGKNGGLAPAYGFTNGWPTCPVGNAAEAG